jgi:hypothetical protein
MPATQFVERTRSGIDEVRISGQSGIQAPFYVPEIKGPEGLEALLYAHGALDDTNPITVPGYRWKDIRSKPTFKDKKDEIKQLISQHPIYYYEPVELFRYTQPKNLVTYAFQGSRSSSREFYQRIRKGDIQKAVGMLPEFFQPFLEAQLERLIEKTSDATVPRSLNTKNEKIHEGWRDQRADQGFQSYFDYLVEDAVKQPDVSIIPPVPPILSSSGQDAISRTRGVNRYMTRLCESKTSSLSGNRVYSYFHIYLDQGVFKSNSRNNKKIVSALEAELDEYDYAGVALTISNYDRAWNNNLSTTLEKFVTAVTNISRDHDLPVVLPRSGWYGTHLTDFGVQAFSSLMNGNLEYTQRATGGMGAEAKYGTVPVYGHATEVNISKLESYLKQNGGQMHQIDQLPSSPPTFNPNASSIKQRFGSARDFRIEFGKPRRLTHVQESRELRHDKEAGVPQPARRYLERSNHPDLA